MPHGDVSDDLRQVLVKQRENDDVQRGAVRLETEADTGYELGRNTKAPGQQEGVEGIKTTRRGQGKVLRGAAGSQGLPLSSLCVVGEHRLGSCPFQRSVELTQA